MPHCTSWAANSLPPRTKTVSFSLALSYPQPLTTRRQPALRLVMLFWLEPDQRVYTPHLYPGEQPASHTPAAAAAVGRVTRCAFHARS
jgi:hypothetical protein